jgi:exopolysaccharide production protein ExoZ
MEPQKLEYIDALRGWAILLVILLHAVQGPMAIDALRLPPWQMSHAILVPSELITRIGLGGECGVLLFFVVSALSLALSWQARHPDGLAGIRDYLLRRFFRIAPMFYIGIVLYLLLFGFGPRQFAPEGISGLDVGLTAWFLHGWWPTAINSVVPGGWSVADEVMFYLVLPALMLAVRSLTWMTVTTIAVVVASRLLLFFLIQHVPPIWPLPLPLLGQMLEWGFQNQVPNFLFGLLAAAVLLKWPRPHSRETRWRIEGVLAVALFALMVASYTYTYNDWIARETIFSAGAGILCVLLHRSPTPILVNRVIARIGRVSFSMYILHFALLAPVFTLVVTMLRALNGTTAMVFPVYFPLLLAATFVASSITFALVEAPFMMLGRKSIAWLRRDSAVALDRQLQPGPEGAI